MYKPHIDTGNTLILVNLTICSLYLQMAHVAPDEINRHGLVAQEVRSVLNYLKACRQGSVVLRNMIHGVYGLLSGGDWLGASIGCVLVFWNACPANRHSLDLLPCRSRTWEFPTRGGLPSSELAMLLPTATHAKSSEPRLCLEYSLCFSPFVSRSPTSAAGFRRSTAQSRRDVRLRRLHAGHEKASLSQRVHEIGHLPEVAAPSAVCTQFPEAECRWTCWAENYLEMII